MKNVISLVLRLLPLPVLLLIVSVATAQHPDVKLSPDTISYAMPTDMLIQSAATIGRKTLVAFGTTAYAPDSSIVSQLRMQMLQDTTLVGGQKSLHGDSARPYG